MQFEFRKTPTLHLTTYMFNDAPNLRLDKSKTKNANTLCENLVVIVYTFSEIYEIKMNRDTNRNYCIGRRKIDVDNKEVFFEFVYCVYSSAHNSTYKYFEIN